jgi:hypothetical protein
MARRVGPAGASRSQRSFSAASEEHAVSQNSNDSNAANFIMTPQQVRGGVSEALRCPEFSSGAIAAVTHLRQFALGFYSDLNPG